jgi:inward rectifier potassium channel
MPSTGPTGVTPPVQRQIVVKGGRSAIANDLYYFLLQSTWWQIILLVVGAFLILNALFAGAYQLSGGVKGARPDSFTDAFFFSVQTLATIGYGAMYPDSPAAHTLVSIEAVTGLLSTAMITGLAFAKFSRPRARLLFTKNAVISLRDGQPTLMIRVANERRNTVAEANMSMTMLRMERTAEGEEVGRLIDLPLTRSHSPAFILTWTGMHKITPDSPLYGATLETLTAMRCQIFVTLIGHDETFGQTIHARQVYQAQDILWNRRFTDIMGVTAEGARLVDYTAFHETQEMPESARLP